jgi:hypothetical protein
MIEIKEKTKVKASIYGREVQLSKPTVGQVERLQDELSSQPDARKHVSTMKKFAIDLGLPADVADSLELDHFLAIVEELSSVKKK